jgi:hypothetical protein
MSFEIGKAYKNRAGYKSVVMADDLKGDRPLAVRIDYEVCEVIAKLRSDGKETGDRPCDYDLIEEWQDPPFMVEFMGLRLMAPPWTTQVAADCDGRVWAFSGCVSGNIPFANWQARTIKLVGDLCREVPEWRDTLKEVTRDR